MGPLVLGPPDPEPMQSRLVSLCSVLKGRWNVNNLGGEKDVLGKICIPYNWIWVTLSVVKIGADK